MPLTTEDRTAYLVELAKLRERMSHVENQVHLSAFGIYAGTAGLIGTILRSLSWYGPLLVVIGAFSVVAFIDRRRYRNDLSKRIDRAEAVLRMD